jgi:hypothetical protein
MAEPEQTEIAVTQRLEGAQAKQEIERTPSPGRAGLAGGFAWRRFGRLFVASR